MRVEDEYSLDHVVGMNNDDGGMDRSANAIISAFNRPFGRTLNSDISATHPLYGLPYQMLTRSRVNYRARILSVAATRACGRQGTPVVRRRD